MVRKNSQFNDGIVFVPLLATSLGFPTIAHVLASARQDQVRPYAEVLVRSVHNDTTSENVSHIKGRGNVRREDRNDVTIDTESRLEGPQG